MDSYLGVVAAISYQKGVEHLHFTTKTFDSAVFIDFVKALRKKLRTAKFVLFMDRAKYHDSKETVKVYKQLGIPYILNAGYTPIGNPIEAVFSAVKQQYQKQKLNYVVNEKDYDKETLIRDSFAKVSLVSI